VIGARSTIPWLAVAGAAALAVAVGVAVGQRSGSVEGYQAAALLAAVLAAGLLAAVVEPALTISAGVALTLFSGQFSQLGSPVGLDRVVLVTGIVAAVVRDLRSEEPRLRTRGIHLLLAALAVYAVLRTMFADNLHKDTLFALADYLGMIPFALFWVAPAAFPTARERRILLTTLVGVGIYLGITAVLETTGPSALVFPGYIVDQSVGIHFGRARGPFVEAAGNGIALYLCAVAAAVAIPQWRRRWILYVALALCATGMLLTLTRQVWLAGIVATGIAMLSRRQLRTLLIPGAVVGAIGVIALVAFVPGLQERADSRLNDRRPVWDRLNSNDAALRMIGERPLDGFGWYTFADSSVPYYRLAADRPLTTVERPHNVILSYAAELGLIATVAWAVALALAVGGGLRRRGPPDLDDWRIGLVAVACAWLVVANFTPMTYAFPHALLWLWAGIAWSRT
jgi:putative inorganic carbon (HCO3(-)) transporter